MTPELDRAAIERLLDAAAARLEGDWLLLGGALVAVWADASRKTEDVDLVAIDERPGDRLALMELADAAGLPVETVNSAADFFLRRVPGWREGTAVLRAGLRARILRPSPTVFLLLKASRMSEDDLADCEAVLALARREGLAVDAARLVQTLDAAAPAHDSDLAARRARLRGLLETPPG